MMKAPPVVRAAHAEAVTGIKHDQYINAGGGGGVYIKSPIHPRRCAATGAPNATERPCEDDVEHATMQVTERDNGAALSRLRRVLRWQKLPFLRF